MAAEYNGPGQAQPGAQRTTYTLGDNVSNIIVDKYRGEDNVGSGRVVGFVIKLNIPMQAQGASRQYDPPDEKYVIFSSEKIDNLSSSSVARMSGGRYNKSRRMRKTRSRRH